MHSICLKIAKRLFPFVFILMKWKKKKNRNQLTNGQIQFILIFQSKKRKEKQKSVKNHVHVTIANLMKDTTIISTFFLFFLLNIPRFQEIMLKYKTVESSSLFGETRASTFILYGYFFLFILWHFEPTFIWVLKYQIDYIQVRLKFETTQQRQ